MDTDLKAKIDTLIADHNSKTDALDAVAKKMQELDAERRKLQDEILFTRGQITAFTSMKSEETAPEAVESAEDTKPVTKKVTGSSTKAVKG